MSMPTDHGRLESEFRAKRALGRKLLVPYITGGYPGLAGGDTRLCGQWRRRRRDRHSVLRSGHGRPRDPTGVAACTRTRGHAAVDPRRGTEPRCRHPPGGHDVLQPRAPPRARAVRLRSGAGGGVRGDPARPPLGGVGAVVRGRRCPWHRDDHAGRADGTRRTPAPCRGTIAGLPLLGRAARGHRRAGHPRRHGDCARRPVEGDHRHCPYSSASVCPTRRRPTRRPASPTG